MVIRYIAVHATVNPGLDIKFIKKLKIKLMQHYNLHVWHHVTTVPIQEHF